MHMALSRESIALLALVQELSPYVICVLPSPQTSETSTFPLTEDFVVCLKLMAAGDKRVLGTAQGLRPGE